MKFPSKIKVTSAFLHQSITWPGVAGAEKTINDLRIKGVQMVSHNGGLYLKSKGQILWVPETNVVCGMVAEGVLDHLFDDAKDD